MHKWMRAAVTAGALAVALTGTAAGSGLASAHAQSDVVGHVYVNDNTAGTNTVAGYDRHADGALTALAGSPFVVGGAGTGGGLAAQGALQLAGDGHYLLAADAGSSQISVLRIRPDGSLRPAEGSPVTSGGDRPVSIATHGNLVYVANAGSGNSNYAGFTLNAGGHLTPLAGSTVAVPAGVVDVLISGDGAHLAGIRVGAATGNAPIDGTIDSFAIGADGRLTPAPGSPFHAQANGPFGSAFDATNAGQLFVSNAHAGAGNGSVSAFDVAANGAVSTVGAPYPNGQTAPCWLDVAPNGQHLYTSNTANSSISAYAIAADGSLTLTRNTALAGPAGVNTRPIDLRLAPDGRDLYVIKAGVNEVGELAVNADGSLSEISAAPVGLPTDAAGSASGIVAN